MSPKTRFLLIALLATLSLSGCGLIYKQNVQQGNAHEQEDLDQVELGMSKKQVAYLLGTPAIHDPFHQDRWDYISMFSRRGGDPVRRLVTLTFEDDILVATDGIGDSTGGDIKALEDTKLAVAEVDDVAKARDTRLITDDAVINWTLQLGAFGTRAEAEKLAEEVREHNYTAKIEAQVVPGLGTRHQVRVGLYDTYNEAREALRRIEKELDIVGMTIPVDISTDSDEKPGEIMQQPPKMSGGEKVTAAPEAENSTREANTSILPATEKTVQTTDAGEDPAPEPILIQAASESESVTTDQPNDAAQDVPQYFVQVGSFSNPANADTLISRLQSLGLGASLKESVILDETIYKVWLGPEASYEAATELADKLIADHDLDAFVTTDD